MTAALVVAATEDLPEPRLKELRALLDRAFEHDFSDDDWAHALGGVHALVTENGALVAHASVVPRAFAIAGRRLSVGYVEAVASAPAIRGRGHASRAMEAIGDVVMSTHDLGALSTGVWDFYARLGWERWAGPTFVDAPAGRVRTAEDDDSVMVLRTPRTAGIDLTTDLTCDWRPGDVW